MRKWNHAEKKRKLKKQTSLLFFRFYIESISFLKDKTTVELFFLNAKSCVHKVRCWVRYVWWVTPDRLQFQGGMVCVFSCSNKEKCSSSFPLIFPTPPKKREREKGISSSQILSGEDSHLQRTHAHTVSTPLNEANIPQGVTQKDTKMGQ